MAAKYHFTHLKSKNFNILTDKTALDYLLKWSIKGQLKLITFCFNESFQPYERQEFIENFFKDDAVVRKLNELIPNWSYSKDEITEVCTEVVPCTISSMSFFDRILEEDNRILRNKGSIRQCLLDVIDGFTIADELRQMLINEESDNYGLYNETDRKELLFKIFQFLVLGGKWSQYEDEINPYIDLTKTLYKDLLRVERNPETKEIQIKSICVQVKLLEKKKLSVFPVDPDHIQNFAYVVIDPAQRQVTLFAHEYGGQFEF